MPNHTQKLHNADAIAHAKRLIALFEHPIREERHRALAQLIGMGEIAVPALVGALHSDEKFTRAGALKALIQLASPEAIIPLIDYVHSHDTEIGDNKAFAMQAIASATSPYLADPKPVFQFLQQRLRDPDQFVRAYSYTALGRLGDPRAMPLLEKGTHDKDDFVAEKAAEAIARLETAPPPPKALTEQLLSPDEIGFALQAPEQARRTMGMEALLMRVNDEQFDPLPMLLRLMRGPNRIGRRSAFEAMSRINNTGVLAPIVRYLQSDKGDSDMIAHALRAIAPYKAALRAPTSPVSHELLMGELKRHARHKDMFVRAAAVALLAMLPGKESIGLLAAACEDRDSWVRDEASAALLEHAGPGLSPYARRFAGGIVRVAERLTQAERPTAEDRTDATVIERLLSLLSLSIPDSPNRDFSEAAAPAAFAAVATPAARVRVAGLSLLHALIKRGNTPSTRSKTVLRNIASALTSTRTPVVHKTLDVLDVVLPQGSGVATAYLTDLLYKGDKDLAIRVINLLARARDIEAKQVLRSLSNNDSLDIAASAIAALREMGEEF